MKTFGKLVAVGLLTIIMNAKAEPISCKLMETMATNTAQQAYEETRNHIELVSQIGLFDTWISITAQLLQLYKQPENAEFLAAAKIAGRIMIDAKDETVNKVAPEGYAKLFGRMTFRICDMKK